MILLQPQLPIEPGNSEWSLRFSHRRHHWRHRSEQDGFRREEFEVSELATDTEARLFIETHHYSGSYVAAIKRYGLYWHGMLVGVLVLSSPMNNRVLTNVFPDLVPGHESVELGRLCLKEGGTIQLRELLRRACMGTGNYGWHSWRGQFLGPGAASLCRWYSSLRGPRGLDLSEL